MKRKKKGRPAVAPIAPMQLAPHGLPQFTTFSREKEALAWSA